MLERCQGYERQRVAPAGESGLNRQRAKECTWKSVPQSGSDGCREQLRVSGGRESWAQASLTGAPALFWSFHFAAAQVLDAIIRLPNPRCL
jgi:hypothetical protein